MQPFFAKRTPLLAALLTIIAIAACDSAGAAAGRNQPRHYVPLAQTMYIDSVDPAELTQYAPLARAAFSKASAEVRAEVETDLARGVDVPALNLATLRTNYGVDPSVMDRQYPGDRITDGAGLEYLDKQPRLYAEKVFNLCTFNLRTNTAFRPLEQGPSIYLLDSLYSRLCHVAASDNSAAGGLPTPLVVRLADVFSDRRQTELNKVASYLEGRIGFGSRISADEERAVLYLSRLARAATDRDGGAAERVRALATRAVDWRNDRVEKRAITEDLREELATRASFERMEATFRANEAIGAREVAAKANRTPAQRDSVRKVICGSFGISEKDCKN